MEKLRWFQRERMMLFSAVSCIERCLVSRARRCFLTERGCHYSADKRKG